MKILCIHQGYELYGSDRSFVLSVQTLKEMYPQASVVAMIPKNGAIVEILEPVCTKLIINEDLAILRKKELKKNVFKMIYKIIKGVKNAIYAAREYDLVYVNTIVVLDYIIASRFIKCPTILHIREIPTGMQKNIFSKIIAFSKMKLIFNSVNTKKSFDLSAHQTQSILLNGVTGYNNISLEKVDDAIHILLIGRLTQWKGQIFFLRALKKLLMINKYNVKVKIIGNVFEDQIDYRNSLIMFVEKNNLKDVVHFKSFSKNPELEYNWSDLVVIPSTKPEPFGRVAIEGMSSSRCVVAANHGGLSEIIENGKDGVLFKPNNIDSLVDELQNLIIKKDLIKYYGDNGKKKFERKFSDNVYKINFNQIISTYLNGMDNK